MCANLQGCRCRLQLHQAAHPDRCTTRPCLLRHIPRRSSMLVSMVLAVTLGRRIVGQHTCMIGYSASSISSRLARGAGGVGGFGASKADRFRALWGDAAAEPHQRAQCAQGVRTSYITRPRPWSCSDHFRTADDLVARPCRYKFIRGRNAVRARLQPPASIPSRNLPPEVGYTLQRRLRG